MWGATSAQSMDFSGGLQVGVSNTDNVFLAPSPDETSETIYVVSPQLNLDYVKQRVHASAGYRFDWYRYTGLDTTDSYHSYDAQLTGEITQDTLFLEIGASRSQSLKNPDAAIPSGQLPISNNLADRDEYYLEPRFEKNFGGSITASAEYSLREIDYDDSDFDETEFIQDNTNQSASFNLNNYGREQGATWAFRYDWRETDYELSLPWEYRSAAVEAGLWVSGKARLFASAGKESPWDDPTDRSLQDGFWELGFAHKSGDRLGAEFAAGERSFGSSWRGELDYVFRRGSLTFQYAEVPTTTGYNDYGRPIPFDPDDPYDLLTRPGEAERFISNRGQVTLDLELRRTQARFYFFDEKRTERFQADGTSLSDEAQRGVSAFFTWQVGIRTSMNLRASVNSREYENAAEDEFRVASLGAQYQLSRTVDLALVYSYSQQDSEGGTRGGDYVANVLSFFATYSF
jgi:hypothetical protein